MLSVDPINLIHVGVDMVYFTEKKKTHFSSFLYGGRPRALAFFLIELPRWIYDMDTTLVSESFM